MTVRVIRVLEYSFPDQATAERSLANGFVPANGVKFIDGSAGSTVIRSATTWPEEVDDAAAEYEALEVGVERQKVGTSENLDPGINCGCCTGFTAPEVLAERHPEVGRG